MAGSKQISIFQWHYQTNQRALYIFYLFFVILYTRLPKNSRKNMFDSDSSDDEYYFEPDKIEHDNSASDSANELRSTRILLRCFNISSDSDSDDELNIEENTSF